MKIILVVALCVVGINALPKTNYGTADFRNERFVTDLIASTVQDLSQSIKDAGLDPLYIESDSGIAALPVPALFSAEGVVEELHFHGLSDIVITNLNFNIFTYRLTFDINIAHIGLTIGKAQVEIDTFGEKYSAYASGSLDIRGIRVNGDIRFRILTGISVRSINIFFNLGGIESALNVVVENWNLSSLINTFLGTTIPYKLDEFSAEINELLEIVIKDVVEANL